MHIREFIEKNYPEYYSIERYPADKCAPFCKVDGPWGIFSNFGRTPILVGGIPFDCSEKLFQVMKFSDTASRRAVYGAKGQTMKMKAKHHEKVGTVRPDWGEIIVDAMKFCLMQKYAQSEAFRLELERSRGLFIIEDQTTFSKKNPDTYPTFTAQYTDETVPNNSLIVECGDKSRYISYDDIFIQDVDYETYSYVYSFDGEGAITSAIDYVVSEEHPMVYALEGHGEAALPGEFSKQIERENYELTSFSLLNEDTVPEDADCVLIYAPASDISEKERDLHHNYI